MSLLGALLDPEVFLGAKCIVVCVTEACMISSSVSLDTADLLNALVYVPSDVNLRVGFLDRLVGPVELTVPLLLDSHVFAMIVSRMILVGLPAWLYGQEIQIVVLHVFNLDVRHGGTCVVLRFPCFETIY